MLGIKDTDQVLTIIKTIKKHIVPKEEYNPDNTEGIDVIQADRHGIDRLAECIFEFYLKRTKYHISLVQKFAAAIADAHPDAWWSHPLLEQALKHDSDKINDLEFAADYAPYLVKKYGPEELTCNFELTPEYKNVWEKDLVVRHCKNNKHHPEGWDKTYDFGENNPPYTPKMMDEVSLAEMCADWIAVGYEMGNKAIDWFNKTNGTRWNWSNSQKTFILNILDDEDNYRSTIDNPPEHPNLFSDEASKIKTISFPKEEIPTVSKQDRIITTRVSADFNRLQLNDLVKTSWGKIYKITKRIVIDNIEKHPYYRELTEGQISFLSKYDKIAVLELHISNTSQEAIVTQEHPSLFSDESLDAYKNKLYALLDNLKGYDFGIVDYSTNPPTAFKGNDGELIRKYKLQVPIDTVRFHCGTCWDIARLAKLELNKIGIKAYNIYYECASNEEFPANHMTCIIPDERGLYIFEASWNKHIGIHGPFENEEDVCKTLAKWQFSTSSNGSAIAFYRVLTYPNSGSTVPEFMKQAKSGTKLFQYTSQQIAEFMSPSSEALSTKVWTEKDINSITDLKQFYNDSKYGTVLNGKCFYGKTLTGQVIDKTYILTVQEQLQYKIGMCYDTVGCSAYFLSKWKIPFQTYLCTTRKEYDTEKGIWDDPTHTFLIYNENGIWKWLEGSWGPYMSNKAQNASAEELVKLIAHLCFKEKKVPCYIKRLSHYPKLGQSIHSFYKEMMTEDIVCAATESLYYSTEAIPAKYSHLIFENTPIKKKIYSICKPYYPDEGSHGYSHIKEVLTTAYVLKGKKDLTDLEYTAILFHDVGRKYEDEKAGRQHNVISEEIARKTLPKLNLFSPEELQQIYTAILNHSHSYRKSQGISDDDLDPLSELVANADKGFPQTTYYDICLRPTLWILEGNDRITQPEKMKRLHDYATVDDIAQGVYETITMLDAKRYMNHDTSLHGIVFAKEKKIQNDLRRSITVPIIRDVVIQIMKDYGYSRPLSSSESISLSNKYDPPYNAQQMRENGYSEDVIARLSKDPIHGWRMKTGIELMHIEPSKSEFMRIWRNWNLMTDAMKKKSDAKSMEILHCRNAVTYAYVLPQYTTENPDRSKLHYPNAKEIEILDRQITAAHESFNIFEDDIDMNYSQEANSNMIYYRITCGRTGVYQALKQNLSKDDWGKFLGSDLATWLPKPKCEYKKNYKSYFTELGYKTFLSKTDSYIKKAHLKDKIETAKYVGIKSSNIVYNDKYQIVTNGTEHVKKSTISAEVLGSTEGLSDYFEDYERSIIESDEALAAFIRGGIYTKITDKAKPYYNPIGQNSWQHIQQVLTQAIKFVKFIEKRELSPVEYAAVLFHDSSCKADPTKDHHARKGAENAAHALKELFTKEELDEICTAIREHDWQDNPEWKFTSNTSDILASADANPPDADWILNKSYTWGIKHRLSEDERIKNSLRIAEFYASTPEQKGMRWPAHYQAYYKKEIIAMRKMLKGLTFETGKARILAYRKKHNLGPTDISMPEPVCKIAPTPLGVIATESLTVSTEALPTGFKAKRKKIEDYVLASIKLLDPHSDVNQKYWKNKFGSMSDQDFDKFMNYIKEKKCNIHMFVPPLKVHLRNAELISAAHKLGVKLMHRIWMTDDNTGLKYLTPEEYMVLQLPVRRQQQFLDEKISVPDNDKTIDGLTGQVTGDSKSCAITNPEIHILQGRNLNNSLYEYANVRGGNIHNYAEFKRALEETGSVSLKTLDPNSRTRVSVMGGVLLSSMMIDNNFNEM